MGNNYFDGLNIPDIIFYRGEIEIIELFIDSTAYYWQNFIIHYEISFYYSC